MPTAYYVLQSRTPVDDDGGYYDIEDGIDIDGVKSWALGTRFASPLPTPIVVPIRAVDGFTGEPPELADGYMCLMSNRVVEALRNAGIDNLDVYPALLRDEENDRDFKFQAVNILGLVRAADLGRSEWENLDGAPAMDTHFDKLAIDEHRARGLLLFRLSENTGTIVVHQRVKEALEQARIPTLVFEPTS